MTGIAYQYALAVFSLAEETSRHEEFKQVLASFAESADEDMYKFFAHPKIERSQKIALLNETVSDTLLSNFLKVLVENDRFELLDAIVMAYQDILDNLHKVMQVTVFSKEKLSKENIAKIEAKLEKAYQRKVEFEFVIEDTIIGGIRIEFEGNVIDETINKQLDELKSSLLE